MTWQTVLALASPLFAIVFSYAAFARNKRKDDTEGGQQIGAVLSELGYIRSGVDDVKRKQERQEEKQGEQHLEVITRLAKVEASASQAHKRIDSITGQKPNGG